MVSVVWRKIALNQLNSVYAYIKKDSLKSAEKVKREILGTVEKLKNNPKIHGIDKYRKNNDGSFRAFERYKFRVAYQVTPKQIRILRVRHTSREPLVH